MSQKITNLNKAAFLLRPVRSYHVLTARLPRPLRAYSVSCEIYGLGNGDHGRSRGALTTIMGSYHASSTCIASARRPPGVSTTFSRRLYIKRIKFFGNFQRIIVQSYCTINIWCSISKLWYLLIWWWKRNTVMKTTWSWWGRHGIGVVLRTPWYCLCKCNHFCGVFATRVLRMYYVYGDVTTLGSRPSRPHHVLTAFQVRSPNLGVCFEHAQNKTPWLGDHWRIIGDHGDHSTMSAFLPRLYHALWRSWRALDPFFRRRRRAVRTPPRCDGVLYNEVNGFHSVCITICERSVNVLLKRCSNVGPRKMFWTCSKLFRPQRVSAFADNRITLITHALAIGKRPWTLTNVSQKNWKTLGVRWPNRHGVTAPLPKQILFFNVENSINVKWNEKESVFLKKKFNI